MNPFYSLPGVRLPLLSSRKRIVLSGITLVSSQEVVSPLLSSRKHVVLSGITLVSNQEVVVSESNMLSSTQR